MNTTGKLASIIMGRSQDKEDKEGDREMNAYKVPTNPYFSFSCLFLSLLPTNVESTSLAEAETRLKMSLNCVQVHNSMFKFGRQRSTINILSTLEEKNKLEEDNEAFEEEDEEELTVLRDEDEDKVIVKMRNRDGLVGGNAAGRTKRSNSVMPVPSEPSSLVLRGRDGRGAPVWMLERSRSAYLKPR